MRPERVAYALLFALACPTLPAIAQAVPTGKQIPQAVPAVEVEEIGSTYTWAQVAAWLDQGRFAVGRWDATITLFRPPVADNKEFGAVLTQALQCPSAQGVQMLVRHAKGAFVTSNDEASLAVWRLNGPAYAVDDVPKYDATFGVANSGDVVLAAGKRWLVTGHSEGYLLIWEVDGARLRLEKSVNIRSGDPIPAPFRAWNIRSVVRCKGSTVATGGEDGDICLVDIPEGKVRFRMRYNPAAKRGINSLAVDGDLLLLANCSVGPQDRNLWLYRLKDNAVDLLDSTNLVKDRSRPQVFNFAVVAVAAGPQAVFFASTEEGLLWQGTVADGKLSVRPDAKKIEAEGGAALAYEPEGGRLIVVAHAVRLYKVSQK